VISWQFPCRVWLSFGMLYNLKRILAQERDDAMAAFAKNWRRE